MELLSVKDVYKDKVIVQRITTKQDDTIVINERIVQEPLVVGICHDPINDKILMLERYHIGSMGCVKEFPNVHVDSSGIPHEALEKYITESTEALIKSSTYLSGYYALPSLCYAPVELFYCTFDSRTVMKHSKSNQFRIIMKTAKELIREVESGLHDDINVIYAAQYLKLLHNKLVQ